MVTNIYYEEHGPLTRHEKKRKRRGGALIGTADRWWKIRRDM